MKKGDSGNKKYVIDYTYNACILKGTLITLADGTSKPVEELTGKELLRTFNFHTGSIGENHIGILKKHLNYQAFVMHMKLTNGQELLICDEQCFFDMDSRYYFDVNADNYTDAIGKRILCLNGENAESAVIESISAENTICDAYEICTDYDLNFVANNIVTIEPGTWLPGVYEITEDLTINMDKYREDVAEYGVYDYSEFADMMEYESFLKANMPDKKIAIGKGYCTSDEYMAFCRQYCDTYNDARGKNQEGSSNPIYVFW